MGKPTHDGCCIPGGMLCLCCSQAHCLRVEAELSELQSQLATAVGKVSDLTSARHAAELETSAAAARARQLQEQVLDLQQQMAACTARLSSTEKSLQEANTRAGQLQKKLTLTETEARIKVRAVLGIPCLISRNP